MELAVGLFGALAVGAHQPGGMPGLFLCGLADEQPQAGVDLIAEARRDHLLARQFLELGEQLGIDAH